MQYQREHICRMLLQHVGELRIGGIDCLLRTGLYCCRVRDQAVGCAQDPMRLGHDADLVALNVDLYCASARDAISLQFQ